MNSDQHIPQFLLSSVKFGIQMGLMRMESLLKRLGNPEASLQCIHVAGTNGKGSTVAFLSSMLACAGYRTGVYTSPFLERFSERIRVLNGREGAERYQLDDAEGEISDECLFRLSAKVEEAVKDMLQASEEHPTEFELVTAVAFLYFREMCCEFVVLETGLGGRLDSTNVIQKPVCTIITALGYDHMDRLGSTMREITAEKAGIIKQGCPVFAYDPYATDMHVSDAKDAREVIIETCKRLNAELTFVTDSDIKGIDHDRNGQTFSLSFFSPRVHISLLGEHQCMNAAVSVRAVLGVLSESAILKGICDASWKARFEVLRRNPLIILDGGHNPQGAKAFRLAADSLFSSDFHKNPPRYILGFMRDKDVEGILDVLFGELSYDVWEIICVSPENPRSMPSLELKASLEERFSTSVSFYKSKTSMYNRQGMITAYDSVAKGCQAALRSSDEDGAPILCIGSLYLAGEARAILRDGTKETFHELA